MSKCNTPIYASSKHKSFLMPNTRQGFFHVKGTDNTDADGLSRLPMMDGVPQASMQSLMSLNNLDRSNDDFPIDMRRIAIESRKMQRYRDLSKDGSTKKSLVSMSLTESMSSLSMGKFGSLRTYKNDLSNGTTMSFNMLERLG